MTRYQIFLPPPTGLLTPLDPNFGHVQAGPDFQGHGKGVEGKELRFLTLSPPSEGLSQSLSLPRRLDLAGKTWTEFSQGGLESLERSTVLKRSLALDDSDHAKEFDISDEPNLSTRHEKAEQAEESMEVDGSAEGSVIEATPHEAHRRKSRRLTRLSASFLSALPQYEPTPAISTQAQDDSYDSLDTTTASWPSQLATNPGNTSVSNFPRWSVPLHRLSTLQSVLSPHSRRAYSRNHIDKWHTLIACVISTEQVIQRQRKEEKARGEEGSLWIGKWMITSPPTQTEGEVTCSVRLWDAMAREWGETVRRGDVVLLENVEVKASSNKEPTHLSISSHHTSRITILYRTIPRYTTPTTANDYIYRPPSRLRVVGNEQDREDGIEGKMLREDKVLRPDLRVGRSDVGVKRVEGVVRWFADWVGGEAPG